MQPPPRKGQYIKVCKNLHTEQLSKLQAKNQQECDLLEDIRNFTKQRSAIEKSYGEALCKISSTYQNKKIACVPDIRLEDGSEAWNIYNVWRTVLDETEKLGKARLAAVEVFHQRISEDAKHTRQIKINLQKKLTETLSTIQKELQVQVQDLDRTKKLYYDEENVAFDAREKACAAEEKLKRKKGSLFQSISSLQKNSAKFTAKKELCDEKSAGARNDYLLTLASTNAHQKRYYEVDFEKILRTMENDMYDKVAEYFTLISRTELLTCTATQNSYSVIKEQAGTITRGYNLRCYLTFYPMLGKNIEYEFEPCKGDKIEKITSHDENSKEQLNLESQRCVAKILKEAKTIREATKKINKLQSSQKAEELSSEVESKIEEIRQIIRRCETSKAKAEARAEMLKEGGVEVEDYSKVIENESIGDNAEATLSRSGSSMSVKEEIEFKESEVDVETVSASEKQISVDSSEMEKDQTIIPAQDQVATKSNEPSWDPLTADWGDEPVSPLPPVTNGPVADEVTYPKCIVQYNYTAQNVDEITIVENEELEVISEGDGDGWIQARNYKGEIGYIPQNYVEMEDGSAVPVQSTITSEYSEDITTTTEAYGTSNGHDTQYCNTQADGGEELEAPVSFSSIDYSFETGDEVTETVTETEGGTYSYEPYSEPPLELPPPPPTIIEDGEEKHSLPSIDILPSESRTWPHTSCYCRAIYDYEATCPEELTFDEGQIIKILRKNIHDVDDGWWEGEITGQIGLFPSLVVEECRIDGEPLTPDAASLTSPCTTPPPHTPPEVPGFLLPPERVIITQPTPDVETAEESSMFQKHENNHEREIVGEQQKHYQRQFSSSPDSETATEREQQYAELISSPDQSNQDEDSKNRDVSEISQPLSSSIVVKGNESQSECTTLSKTKEENDEEEEYSLQMSSEERETETFTSTEQDFSKGLGVAEIVVTAATPMKEIQEHEEVTVATEDSRAEADQTTEDDCQVESEDTEGESNFLDDDRPPPPPPAPEGGGGSGVEERHEEYESELNNSSSVFKQGVPTVLLSKAETKESLTENDFVENSGPTPKSPTPSEGPPDLDPEKLKTLEKIKESIA